MQNNDPRLAQSDYADIYARMRPESPHGRPQPPATPPPPIGIKQNYVPTITVRKVDKQSLGFAVITVLLLGFAVFLVWPSSAKTAADLADVHQALAASASTAVTEQPTSTSQNGSQSNNYQYDAAKKTATFTDSISDTKLFISDQLQPASPKLNEAFLKKIADANGANTGLTTTKGKAFIIQGAGSSQQVVIFADGQQLVVVNAQGLLSQADWLAYINNFHSSIPSQDLSR